MKDKFIYHFDEYYHRSTEIFNTLEEAIDAAVEDCEMGTAYPIKITKNNVIILNHNDITKRWK